MTSTVTHTFTADDKRARFTWNGTAYRATEILNDNGSLSVNAVRVTKTGTDFKRGANFIWLTLENSLEKFPNAGGTALAAYVREITIRTIPAHLRHYVLDMAASKGDMVCQGHADVCKILGHGKNLRNGVELGTCPRCGDRNGK